MKCFISIITVFFISVYTYSQNADTTVYETIMLSSFPVLPGCEDTPTEKCFVEKIHSHVRQYLKYPEMAKEIGAQGKVYVKFICETDGTISDIQVVRSVEKSLDAEAIRVIKKLPKALQPAMINNKQVRVYYVLPISFVLH